MLSELHFLRPEWLLALHSRLQIAAYLHKPGDEPEE
jgi:hypothetical protein